MEENKRLKFGYEDTDKRIEIDLYGLVFEIKNLDSLEKLESLDKEDSNAIETQLEKILGEGSIEKINNKRVNDGYKKLSLDIELNILGCIFETYAKSTADNILGRVVKAVGNINNDMKVENMITRYDSNREQRRIYNRNQYRGNRRNYRRY